MKDQIVIQERGMDDAEYAGVVAGFAEHAAECGVPHQEPERLGYVAEAAGECIGASSGLAYRDSDSDRYADWFFLTDLYVDKSYRRCGIGSRLLVSLETRVAGLGIGNIYTWTAGYEAPSFYATHGYRVFLEKTGFYGGGHSRLGLAKTLRSA
ncbi:MAG: GNAT family N-acetyltransferase [Planctomycetota bacterium]